jgi:hypothetical protein
VTGRCLQARGLRDWRHDWQLSSKVSLQLHRVRRRLNAACAFRHVELDLVGTTRVVLVRGSDVVATVTGGVDGPRLVGCSQAQRCARTSSDDEMAGRFPPTSATIMRERSASAATSSASLEMTTTSTLGRLLVSPRVADGGGMVLWCCGDDIGGVAGCCTGGGDDRGGSWLGPARRTGDMLGPPAH